MSKSKVVLSPDLKVLVVDDEPFSQTIVVRMLRDMGCGGALTANTGGKAIGAFTETIHLAIIDFNMPDMSGLELLRKIRSGETLAPRDLPVVMLTGSANKSLVDACMALDLHFFVIKPVSKTALEERLISALRAAKDIKIKPANAYKDIDVKAIENLLIPHRDSLASLKPVEEFVDPNHIKISLAKVPSGAVLAEDICTPHGDLLLKKGQVLTHSVINRLMNLSGPSTIDTVTVEKVNPKTEK